MNYILLSSSNNKYCHVLKKQSTNTEAVRVQEANRKGQAKKLKSQTDKKENAGVYCINLLSSLHVLKTCVQRCSAVVVRGAGYQARALKQAAQALQGNHANLVVVVVVEVRGDIMGVYFCKDLHQPTIRIEVSR